MSLGVVCDVLVWYYSKDLEIFYSEPAVRPLTTGQPDKIDNK
jgi:hypothetical protein